MKKNASHSPIKSGLVSNGMAWEQNGMAWILNRMAWDETAWHDGMA